MEDAKGNKHVLKATVISVSRNIKKSDTSAEILDETLEELGLSEKIVRPPLSQSDLAVLQEISSELGQTIDAMVIGIEGFGGRLLPRTDEKDFLDGDREAVGSFITKNKEAITEEKSWLKSMLDAPNAKGSFVKLRKETREDLEANGNAYWELVPSLKAGRYSCMNKLDVATMYITKTDKNFTTMEVPYVNGNLEIQKKKFQVKFRRYVQVVGNAKVYFKEFADPRPIDRRTGEVLLPGKSGGFMNSAQEPVDKKFLANEVYHFKIYTPRRTPYGLPRFTGNIIAIKGSRSADETNIITQQNNHVPSMAVMVSGGQLTEGSIKRVQEFVDVQIKSDSNYSKFLLLEAESSHDGLSPAGSAKVEIKPLTDAQHSDQLWQNYDENNAKKIRRSFRIAPILVGDSANYDRATAQVSEALTEKYVYNPEREEMDAIINRIFLQQSIRFWKFKSNSPNVTNDEDLVAILTGAERSGALTPRIARDILGDILNKELPGFVNTPEDFNPDVPFSYTLAQLMHSAGKANQNGTMTPQGQTPKAPGRNGRPPKDENLDADGQAIEAMVDPEALLNKLLEKPERTLNVLRSIRDSLEDSLDTDTFGGPLKDYGKHEH